MITCGTNIEQISEWCLWLWSCMLSPWPLGSQPFPILSSRSTTSSEAQRWWLCSFWVSGASLVGELNCRSILKIPEVHLGNTDNNSRNNNNNNSNNNSNNNDHHNHNHNHNHNNTKPSPICTSDQPVPFRWQGSAPQITPFLLDGLPT